MIVVLLKDEYNQKFMQLLVVYLTLQCYNKIVSADRKVSDTTESTERKKNRRRYDETKLHRAEDKYVGPLVLQLFVITAKHTHYVTLQLRLATLVI